MDNLHRILNILTKSDEDEIKNDRKRFYDNERLMRNLDDCIQMCKTNSNYKLCSYDTTATKYAIASIKIYVTECSEIVDHTDIIRFNNYIENCEFKNLPYNCTGLIPNYKYIVGDNAQFEKNNYKTFNKDYSYYLIDLKIPFIMD
jgi:hypothetical protein